MCVCDVEIMCLKFSDDVLIFVIVFIYDSCVGCLSDLTCLAANPSGTSSCPPRQTANTDSMRHSSKRTIHHTG